MSAAPASQIAGRGEREEVEPIPRMAGGATLEAGAGANFSREPGTPEGSGGEGQTRTIQ